MAQSGNGSDFFTKINKIVNYFARSTMGSFLFCSYDDSAVLGEINKTIIYRAKEKKLTIREIFFSSEDSGYFLDKIRDVHKEKPDGIIISNLDELIVLTKDQIITEINLARDILLGLKLPFLFFVSKENISKFANQAQDLFLRRDRGVIHFSDIPRLTKLDKLRGFQTIDYRDSAGFGNLTLKIGLLESQLKEAEEKKYNPERIANEIALDLIQVYLKALLVNEAKELFYKYGSYFNLNDNLKNIDTVADLYAKTSQWDEALNLYLKSKKIREHLKDMQGLSIVLNNIASIYFNKGILSKAFDHYLESKQIVEMIGDRKGLGHILNAMGNIYLRKDRWDKALEFYLKGKVIFEKVGDKASLKKVNENIQLIKKKTLTIDANRSIVGIIN